MSTPTMNKETMSPIFKLDSTWNEIIKNNLGYLIKINDQIFTLSRSYEMAGILAIWESQNYTIYAHPNFDGIGVPVDVWYNGESIGDNYYSPEVFSFEEYTEKVKEMAEGIIREHEKELIFNFVRLLRTCKKEELNQMSSMALKDFLLNSEDKERQLPYSSWLSTIQTVLFIKENSERYSLFDKDSFFEAYSFCGGLI